MEKQKHQKLNKDQIITLMEIYLSEWQHRDSMLWQQVFKYFYVTLIVIILPNIAEFLKIALPPINKKLFPIIGIFMAVMFLYVGIGYALRLKAIGLTYTRMMQLLGNKKYKRISIRNRKEIKYGWQPSL